MIDFMNQLVQYSWCSSLLIAIGTGAGVAAVVSAVVTKLYFSRGQNNSESNTRTGERENEDTRRSWTIEHLSNFVESITPYWLQSSVVSSSSLFDTSSITSVVISKMSGKKTVSIPIDPQDQSTPVPSEEHAKRSVLYPTESVNDCMKFLYADCKTLADVFHRGHRVSNNGLCLGKIVTASSSTTGSKSNPKNGPFVEWINYESAMERIVNFGSGLISLGLTPGSSSKIGIYATNSLDYVIAEHGAYAYSMTVVPLYDTLGPKAVSFILNEAEITVALCDSEDRLKALICESDHIKQLQYVIVLGTSLIESYRSKASGYGIKVHTIGEIEQLGKANPVAVVKPKVDDLAVICYTSGTTGTPKGVMLTHENVIANLSSVMYQLGDHAPRCQDTYMSFLPLAHMFERCCESAVLMVGSKVAFFSGDIRNLSTDLKIIKPTVIPCVPRICNRIYSKTFASASSSKIKLWLLKKALAAKEREVNAGLYRSNSLYDKLVFRPIREGLGGSLRLMVIGAAPLDPDVLTFMRCSLGSAIIVEGYGQTECVCPCTLTIPGDSGKGYVGPPLSSCYVKLVDVPEMEYYASNNTGEVCVKGPIVFKGYFKEPGKTEEALDADGWLHTGDIGTWLPNGTLKIIDRKKHIFKLSQGEYIAPEKIESIYSKSHFVSQIFIYGESLKSCLVGVVVPELDVIHSWLRERNIHLSASSSSMQSTSTVVASTPASTASSSSSGYGSLLNSRDICADSRVKTAILEDLHSIGRKEGLKPFEQVKDIFLYPEAFSIDNGLLTPTLKTKRPECRKFFASQLEEMYRSLD